jgi:hypothetical protein
MDKDGKPNRAGSDAPSRVLAWPAAGRKAERQASEPRTAAGGRARGVKKSPSASPSSEVIAWPGRAPSKGIVDWEDAGSAWDPLGSGSGGWIA